MGFLGDLFASKGTVETVLTVAGLPSGTDRTYTLHFVPVKNPSAPPPRSRGDGARSTASLAEARTQNTLPAGFYQVQVMVQPVQRGTAGKSIADKTRELPFWPLSAAIEVKKGETTRVDLNVAFPRAGLPDAQ